MIAIIPPFTPQARSSPPYAMIESISFLSAGLLLGLSGGLSPGPLLALVASETLHHGVRAGIS
ncbi:MAG: hypothetical protein RKP20_09980, partial [Candidatus Competibacter sp.]|nr:hypothetical protein [Candidatus Competibacter sp.]